MSLTGWINQEDFYQTPDHILSDQEIYDKEPDRTNEQVRLIMKLMIQKGYKRIEDIHSSFIPKSNGKISIGMASKIIDKLIKIK
ncbi:MAG: hypothetical protein H6743_03820 [Rickettsiaceae bacterium]|nr:hypothetical protein [Rickettsiaceae bacterium]